MTNRVGKSAVDLLERTYRILRFYLVTSFVKLKDLLVHYIRIACQIYSLKYLAYWTLSAISLLFNSYPKRLAHTQSKIGRYQER